MVATPSRNGSNATRRIREIIYQVTGLDLAGGANQQGIVPMSPFCDIEAAESASVACLRRYSPSSLLLSSLELSDTQVYEP